MDIEDVRLFTEIVAYRCISEAARKNSMSQQTLSRRLANMERELGHRLFERTTPLTPTPAGTVFLHHAYELIATYDAMKAEMDRVSRERPRIVRVKQYVTGSFASVLSRANQILQQSHPEIRMELLPFNEDDQRLVIDGTVDIGFVRYVEHHGVTTKSRVPGVDYVELQSNRFPLVFGVPDGHPLLRMDSPTLSDISRFHLALPSFEDRGALPNAIKILFSAMELPLHVDMVYATSMPEYYAAALPDSVYLFNEAYSVGDVASAARNYHAIRPSDGEYLMRAALVHASDNADPAVAVIIDGIKEADAGLANEMS